jgi:hypothetical protein
MLGEDDKTLFIRENVFGISKLKSDTDVRKIVQKKVVENCIIIYAIYCLLLCVIISILPSY